MKKTKTKKGALQIAAGIVLAVTSSLSGTMTRHPTTTPAESAIPAPLPAPPTEISSRGNKYYFDAGTQAAIVAFQKETDRKKRESLYVKSIMPAFEKLVENLINIYKFTSLYDTYEDLKNDCVNFLFETIPKFDESRGTRAFAYFNIVAKHWLLIKTKQKAQKIKRSISLDDPGSLTVHEHIIIEEHNLLPSQDDILDGSKSLETTLEMMYDIRTKVKTENELVCINSIITIFENIDDIDLLNKGAILLYMRELSGLSPKQLTTTMHSIKKHYKKLLIESKKG
jgi:hypothetical protein